MFPTLEPVSLMVLVSANGTSCSCRSLWHLKDTMHLVGLLVGPDPVCRDEDVCIIMFPRAKLKRICGLGIVLWLCGWFQGPRAGLANHLRSLGTAL